MREIKFRVWDKEKNNWYHPSPFTLKQAMSYTWVHENPFADLVFMQYTGLKDKNGKEIYEGDILETKKGIYHEAHWGSKCGFAVATKNKWAPTKSKFVYKSMLWGAENGVVIGNAYENPGLLN
jgi:uncharacterized phage protein (TIGR01671 family)